MLVLIHKVPGVPKFGSRSTPGWVDNKSGGARGGCGCQGGGLNILRFLEIFLGDVCGFFGLPRAPGWPETDSPRSMMASSGVETEIRALGTRFVAIFRFAAKLRGAPAELRGANARLRGANARLRGASAELRGASARLRGAAVPWIRN